MGVTIRTVAKEADVSPATVSRVFNDTAPVEESTRERILDAADRLGYVPNATARSLSLKENRTFGVLLPFLTGEYFPEVIRGLDQAARKHNRLLMLSSSHHAPDDLRRALSSMNGRIDGIALMLPQLVPSDYKEYLPSDVPAVLLNSSPEGHELSVVSIDNKEGGRLATEHLIELGHRRIGIITGEPANRDAQERLNGYREAMQDAGLDVPDDWIAEGDFERESGAEAARKLLSANRPPTAIFASNDYMAMGAIRSIEEQGYSVPADVSVIGFDNVPSSRHFTPALSTIDARMVGLGSRAISILMEVSHDSTTERRVELLEPQIRERDSAASPR